MGRYADFRREWEQATHRVWFALGGWDEAVGEAVAGGHLLGTARNIDAAIAIAIAAVPSAATMALEREEEANPEVMENWAYAELLERSEIVVVDRHGKLVLSYVPDPLLAAVAA